MSDLLQRLTAALADRYALDRELGAGGMATVYLAEDLKHRRNVAVKVLRPELAAILGAERFLKEIEVTANLQHPNILPLYDSGEADSFLYYVMPYIEGESLRDKLLREKQLEVEEAVEIARSVAAALEYAHGHGVVHRDIKPENILLQSGQALVADFGIALAVSAAGGTRLTETGLSLGTPHYMSPEQATGDRELTPRSDIYSLGCVTYEMLAGDPPHTGNTAQAIVAKVLSESPMPIARVRDFIPPNVDAAVQRALAKSPADRFGTAADFAAALTNPAFTLPTTVADVPVPGPTSLWNPLSIATTVVAVVAVAIAGWGLFRPEDGGPVTRFAVAMGSTQALLYSGSGNPPRLALSPNGHEVVYVGASDEGPRLWHRSFAQLEAQPVLGGEGGWAPVISPDGERVAFMDLAGRSPLKIASLTGGPAITVVDSGIGRSSIQSIYGNIASPRFHTWGPDDYLYFFDETGVALRRVSADGGLPEDVVTLDPIASGFAYSSPYVLPGARGAIVTALPPDRSQTAEYTVHVIDLESGASRASVAGVFGTYAASGHLVYLTSGGTLMAMPFDAKSLALTGRAAALLEGVDVRDNGMTDVTLSANGTLAYATVGYSTPEEIVWVTRTGEVEKLDPGWVGELEVEGIAVSPDGGRLAVELITSGRPEIWIKQLDRGPLSRLTFGGGGNSTPTWMPDGNTVSFALANDRRIASRKRADGSGPAEVIQVLDRRVMETRWSSDGAWLVMSVAGSPGSDDIVAMRPGIDSVPVPLLTEPFDEFEPALSPDDRWLAYVSDESGQLEVYVRPFPNVGDGRWQISTGGGKEPLWSVDGRELFYRSLDSQSIFTADMAGGPALATRRVLLRLPPENDYEANQRNRLYDVSADGRFVMIQRRGVSDISGDLVIVQNFFEELKAKVGN